MKQNLNKLFVFLILIVELVLLTYFGSMKKGMHFDECFSYFNTNNSVGRQAFDRSYVTSEEIMQDFYVKKGEQFNYKYVVQLQSYDVHPPVFYILLHTLCSFMVNQFSIWQGVILNIIYALLTSIFLYLILIKLIDNKLYALIITFLSSINTGMISNVMFIRMYCLLTLFITIAVYIHILMSEYNELNKLSMKLIIFNALLTYLGFLTHYFYLLFIFFLEFFFFLPKVFNLKNHYKGILKYILGMILAGVMGVISYPSCLGHVNSGYRGQEVKGYLLDLSDFKDRFSFFNNLINKYVFNGWMYIFLLLITLLFIFAYYKAKKNNPNLKKVYSFLECILLPVIGYYIVSVKGSLMGDEAMMRYQLPIYNFLIVSVCVILYGLTVYIFNNKEAISLFVLFIVFVISILGLIKKNVFYLYEDQENMNYIASLNKDKDCLYIYNSEDKKYLLWNDFKQLAEYERVYFVNSENMNLIDESDISNSEDLIVYIATPMEHENFDDYTSWIYESNKKVTSYNKLYDATYATVYEFK